MLDESSNLRDYKLFLLCFFLCSSIFVLCFSIFAPSLKRGKTMYAQNKRGVYAENNECGIRKLFSMTVQEWYNIYQTLCLRLQESFYIFKSRFILCVIYRKKSHKFYKDAADCNLEWPHHEQLTCDRHVRTPFVNRRYATSKNVATKNQCYLDVIFMMSDRRVLSDIVRTLVSGRRRRNLHTANARRRVPTG